MTPPSDDRGTGHWRLLARLRDLFTWRQRGRRVANVEPATPSLPSTPQGGPGPGDRRAIASEPFDIIIGLDFGTSSTKVVVRTPYHFGQRAEAIDFGEYAHGSCKYLLPTSLHCEDGGALTLDSGGARHSWSDLKVRLLDAGNNASGSSNDELEAVALASGYLSLVIRLARRTFLARHHAAFGTSLPRWRVNVGIPSAGYDDERVRRLFRASADAGWVLSEATETPTVGVALGVAQEALAGELGLVSLVNVIPEVAAEVVGYARSPRRTSGLHLLIDVGASTLDVCGFVLHDDGSGDRYELLTASVKRLGALELHRRRLRGFGTESLPPGIPGVLPADPVAPIPDNPEEYANGVPHILERLREIDRVFRKECTDTKMEVVMALKKRRDPNSPRWKEGLPVFLCGGASDLALIRDSLESSNRRLAPVGTHLRLLPPPALASLVNNDVDDALVRRLGVAFGLSFDSLDIGTITPPGEIEDISPPKPADWRSGFVDKDLV